VGYWEHGNLECDRVTMIKADIIRHIYENHGFYSEWDIHELVDTVFDIVIDSIVHRESVGILKFGKFKILHKGERPGRNPRTGEEFPVKARDSVTFKASRHLIAKINTVS
jgi:integration host factor subunit alpha